MTKIANLVRKFASKKSLSENLDKAKELYGDKSFAEEHQETYNTILNYGFIPSTLSVASAALVFFYIIPNIHWAIAYTIGLAIALPYEALKSWVSKTGFRAFFKGAKVLMVAVVLSYVVSVCFSSFGAYQGYKLLEQGSKGAVMSKNSLVKDSLLVVHDLAIKEAKTTAQNFHDSNLVKVKNSNGQYVQVLSDRSSVKNTYGDLVQSVESAKEAKRKTLKSHDDKAPSEVENAVNDMGFYLWIVMGLSIINESVIFFFARFKELYFYKSFSEQEVIKQSQNFTLNFESLTKLVEMANLGPGAEPITANYNSLVNPSNDDRGIGFRQKPYQPPNNPSENVSNPFGSANCRNCGQVFDKSRKQHFYCSKDCNREFHKINIK